jgi:hypothetical protein
VFLMYIGFLEASRSAQPTRRAVTVAIENTQ